MTPSQPPKEYHVPQRSEEWEQIRIGRPTASQFGRIFTAKKAELSKSAVGYARQLIADSYVPGWVDFAGNKFTDRGTEMEPEALEAFVAETGIGVEQIGFLTNFRDVVGCSPDGVIRGEGGSIVSGVELKCPSPAVHISYLADGGIPDDYIQQVHGSMIVANCKEWHFWSYFPGLPPLHVVAVRDSYTEKAREALTQFVVLYQEEREVFKRLYAAWKASTPLTAGLEK